MKKRLSIAVALVLVLVMSLAGAGSVSATNSAGYSALFAGTSDPAKVYMYTGSGTAWEDISGTSLSAEVAVLDLIQYQGQLYAGTMDYTNGGRVWRYEGGTTWTLVFDADWPEFQVASLAVYNDTLYAGTAWDGGNLYCYNTDTGTFDYVDTMGDTDSDGKANMIDSDSDELQACFAFGIKMLTYGHHFHLLLGNHYGLGNRILMQGALSNELHLGFTIHRFFEF